MRLTCLLNYFESVIILYIICLETAYIAINCAFILYITPRQIALLKHENLKKNIMQKLGIVHRTIHHKLRWGFHSKQLKASYLKPTIRWTFLPHSNKNLSTLRSPLVFIPLSKISSPQTRLRSLEPIKIEFCIRC